MEEKILALSLKNIKEVDDVTKQRLGKWGRRLLGLSIETVKLSEQCQIESDKGLIFDFTDSKFSLWSIIGEEAELEIRDYYNSRSIRVYVTCFFKAAKNEWFGKTIERDLLIEGVKGIYWPAMNRGIITPYIKGSRGRKLFGYHDGRETVEITYIPKEVIWKKEDWNRYMQKEVRV